MLDPDNIKDYCASNLVCVCVCMVVCVCVCVCVPVSNNNYLQTFLHIGC